MRVATGGLLLITRANTDTRKNANIAGIIACNRREVFNCMVHPWKIEAMILYKDCVILMNDYGGF